MSEEDVVSSVWYLYLRLISEGVPFSATRGSISMSLGRHRGEVQQEGIV